MNRIICCFANQSLLLVIAVVAGCTQSGEGRWSIEEALPTEATAEEDYVLKFLRTVVEARPEDFRDHRLNGMINYSLAGASESVIVLSIEAFRGDLGPYISPAENWDAKEVARRQEDKPVHPKITVVARGDDSIRLLTNTAYPIHADLDEDNWWDVSLTRDDHPGFFYVELPVILNDEIELKFDKLFESLADSSADRVSKRGLDVGNVDITWLQISTAGRRQDEFLIDRDHHALSGEPNKTIMKLAAVNKFLNYIVAEQEIPAHRPLE